MRPRDESRGNDATFYQAAGKQLSFNETARRIARKFRQTLAENDSTIALQ
jgi:hypothetical protein